MQISVIIVNYNTLELTSQCVASIFEFTQNISYEIIIVDNASVDGSVDYLKRNFPEVKIIESTENLGFGKANNLGAKYAFGEYVLLLNSDTILIENSILRFYEFFTKNEKELKIGIIGCLLCDSASNINGYGSNFPAISDGLTNVFNRLLKTKRQDHFGKANLLKEYFIVDYIIGADMFLRRSLFKELGGFDEDFFMYYEESEFQMRTRQMGLKSYVITETRIVHLEEGSVDKKLKLSNNRRKTIHKSRNLFFKKHSGKRFIIYKLFDQIMLYLNVFNPKYKFHENLEYIKYIKNSY